MTGILAIDTSTDSCSVAVTVDGHMTERYEHAPRAHSQLLWEMLRDLLPNGDLRSQGIDAIAYGSGPGSFTGLRIAASAVQGLAYTSDLPAVAVPTLAAMAQAALRRGCVTTDAVLLCSLDARIKEIYSAIYCFQDGLAVLLEGPLVCAPRELAYVYEAPLVGVGGGLGFVEEFPDDLVSCLGNQYADLLPAAQDYIPLAKHMLRSGEIQTAQQVQPMYVRDEISWKKISEQGKRQ